MQPIEGDALNYAIGVTNDHINKGGIIITSVDSMDEDDLSIEDLLPDGFSVST